MRTKTAVIQLDVKAGCFEQNFNNAQKWISKANETGAELVALPELCLSGKFVGGKWKDHDFLAASKKYTEKLIETSQGITLVFGAYSNGSCVYICENGKLLNRYEKTDEAVEVFVNASQEKVFVKITADPWVKEKKAFECDTPIIYANCCGCQNTGKNIFVFDGGCGDLKPFEEGISFGNMGNPRRGSHGELPLRGSIREMQIMAIIRAYKGMDELLGFAPKYVFGLSGGVDSSLACALAVKALGKDRVIGYNFPGEHSSEKTQKAAELLAKNLGIEYNVVPIIGIQKEIEKSLGNVPALVRENIQAKIRTTDLLSNFAQIHNGIMTCNGNKLEAALGYCTLYGDTGGAFAPLGDLLKTEVFELARSIEEIPRELIPTENMEFEEWQIYPSAELSNGQRDPMKFGYHDRLLEAIMSRKISASQTRELYSKNELFSFLELPEQLIKLYNLKDPQIFEQDLKWFLKRLNTMAFKRMQVPPVLTLSNSAFGYGYAENLSITSEELA